MQLPPLDLPIAVWGRILPVLKFVWIGLFAWMAIRLVDLGMAIYTNSEHLQHRRNLSDMIVPTSARVLKLAMLIVAISWEVYLVGNGEWVTRLLAGLGLVGLAASLAARNAQEFLRHLAVDRRASVQDRRLHCRPWYGGDGRERRLPLHVDPHAGRLVDHDSQLDHRQRLDRQPGAATLRRYRTFIGVAYALRPID